MINVIEWGGTQRRNTHSKPDWDFLPAARERDFTDLKEKKTKGDKKLDIMGKYATFQTKYWQNVGRKISQWYKEHFQRKVFIERLRRVASYKRTLHWNHHRVLNTHYQQKCLCKRQIIFNTPEGAAAFQQEEKNKNGWKLWSSVGVSNATPWPINQAIK